LLLLLYTSDPPFVEQPVLIEGGRATADPEFGVMRFNFFARPEMALTSATWFLKEDPKDHGGSGKVATLIPLTDKDAAAVEELFQKAIYAASSLGKGIDPILKEEVPIEENYNVRVEKSSDGHHYLMRKSPKAWFGKSYDLQRGYGSYTVEGEEEEETLGPVRHLIFVVHGIRDDFTYTSSLFEDVTSVRLTMQKQQIAEWEKACELAKKEKYVVLAGVV
jgi:hypothetical protein